MTFSKRPSLTLTDDDHRVRTVTTFLSDLSHQERTPAISAQRVVGLDCFWRGLVCVCSEFRPISSASQGSDTRKSATTLDYSHFRTHERHIYSQLDHLPQSPSPPPTPLPPLHDAGEWPTSPTRHRTYSSHAATTPGTTAHYCTRSRRDLS